MDGLSPLFDYSSRVTFAARGVASPPARVISPAQRDLAPGPAPRAARLAFVSPQHDGAGAHFSSASSASSEPVPRESSWRGGKDSAVFPPTLLSPSFHRGVMAGDARRGDVEGDLEDAAPSVHLRSGVAASSGSYEVAPTGAPGSSYLRLEEPLGGVPHGRTGAAPVMVRAISSRPSGGAPGPSTSTYLQPPHSQPASASLLAAFRSRIASLEEDVEERVEARAYVRQTGVNALGRAGGGPGPLAALYRQGSARRPSHEAVLAPAPAPLQPPPQQTWDVSDLRARAAALIPSARAAMAVLLSAPEQPAAPAPRLGVPSPGKAAAEGAVERSDRARAFVESLLKALPGAASGDRGGRDFGLAADLTATPLPRKPQGGGGRASSAARLPLAAPSGRRASIAVDRVTSSKVGSRADTTKGGVAGGRRASISGSGPVWGGGAGRRAPLAASPPSLPNGIAGRGRARPAPPRHAAAAVASSLLAGSGGGGAPNALALLRALDRARAGTSGGTGGGVSERGVTSPPDLPGAEFAARRGEGRRGSTTAAVPSSAALLSAPPVLAALLPLLERLDGAEGEASRARARAGTLEALLARMGGIQGGGAPVHSPSVVLPVMDPLESAVGRLDEALRGEESKLEALRSPSPARPPAPAAPLPVHRPVRDDASRSAVAVRLAAAEYALSASAARHLQGLGGEGKWTGPSAISDIVGSLGGGLGERARERPPSPAQPSLPPPAPAPSVSGQTKATRALLSAILPSGEREARPRTYPSSTTASPTSAEGEKRAAGVVQAATPSPVPSPPQAPPPLPAPPARPFCAECESAPPSRTCAECKDALCEPCFAALHKKGARATHTWTLLLGPRRGGGRPGSPPPAPVPPPSTPLPHPPAVDQGGMNAAVLERTAGRSALLDATGKAAIELRRPPFEGAPQPPASALADGGVRGDVDLYRRVFAASGAALARQAEERMRNVALRSKPVEARGERDPDRTADYAVRAIVDRAAERMGLHGPLMAMTDSELAAPVPSLAARLYVGGRITPPKPTGPRSFVEEDLGEPIAVSETGVLDSAQFATFKRSLVGSGSRAAKAGGASAAVIARSLKTEAKHLERMRAATWAAEKRAERAAPFRG
jgi:hypothetical protein